MKKIIDGRRFDTETARLVGEWGNELSGRDFARCEESLYCKRTGEYFLAGHGGPASKYSQSAGENTWTGGEAITPLTAEEAREWAEKHLGAEEYELEFTVIEDIPDNRTGQNIKATRELVGISQKALAERMGVGQSRIAEWESGEVDPTATTIYRIASALNIEPGDLLK